MTACAAAGRMSRRHHLVMIAPVGPQAPSHARRYARLVAVASRRARVPPVDYRDDRAKP